MTTEQAQQIITIETKKDCVKRIRNGIQEGVNILDILTKIENEANSLEDVFNKEMGIYEKETNQKQNSQ